MHSVDKFFGFFSVGTLAIKSVRKISLHVQTFLVLAQNVAKNTADCCIFDVTECTYMA